jgi:hypothetical protein
MEREAVKWKEETVGATNEKKCREEKIGAKSKAVCPLTPLVPRR